MNFLRLIFVFSGLFLMFAAQNLFSNPSDKAAVFSFVEGEVKVFRKGGERWIPAQKEMTVFMGDRVLTSETGRAVLVYQDLSTIKMRKNSVCEPLPTESGIHRVKLVFGAVIVNVDHEKLSRLEQKFQVEGNQMIAGVRGTIFSFDEALAPGASVYQAFTNWMEKKPVQRNSVKVSVLEGRVEMFQATNPEQKETITANEFMVFHPSGQIEGGKISPQEILRFEPEDRVLPWVIQPGNRGGGNQGIEPGSGLLPNGLKPQQDNNLFTPKGSSKSNDKKVSALLTLKELMFGIVGVIFWLVIGYFAMLFVFKMFANPEKPQSAKPKKKKEPKKKFKPKSRK